MTPHWHHCNICDSAPAICTDEGCASAPDGLVSLPRLCGSCLAPIAEVDALPAPERGPLSYATVDRVVSRATRAAIQAAARDPEDGPRKFAEHVEPLYATTGKDPTDAWARHGAVMGAKAGWSGDVAFNGWPPDCPPGAAARMYLGAWSFASGVVMQVRSEVGNHG
jgi:hypothetical protein